MEIPVQGNAHEIYGKIKTKFEEYVAQKKIAQLKEVCFQDDQHLVTVVGTGFTGKIQCVDTKITIDFDLSLFLKPMRGQIEEMIKRVVDKALA